MSCIKRVDRSAYVAMAPEAPFIAAGTMAGAVDLSFSSSSNLEIFELDFNSEDHEMKLLGQSSSSERFTRLAWGSYGSGSQESPYGCIAGGLVDGNIGLWNPLTLIRYTNATYNPPPGLHLNSKIHQTVVQQVELMVPTQRVAVQPPPAPVAPPPTVQTVDTSNVPAHQKHIVATLTRLFKETSDTLGPAKKRDIEGISRKVGSLFAKLNNEDISKHAAEKLALLCQALDKHDFNAALQIQRYTNATYNPPPALYLNSKIHQTVVQQVELMVPAQRVAVQPPPAPVAPPPTVQTADTSNVPAHQKPIVATLTRLFKETSDTLGPAKKRDIEGISKKVGSLFAKLNNEDISKHAAEKLSLLCQALDKQD
ncbi:hypothetical protein F2Q70_00040199 [Brassica cretica]|uniref:Uncharacterized protein n=1 Tax=Brassica cretica TaxID=69181 RepID=A0A8S9K734_BRACR|nr:hypothetical protein F2Q70_00040199 [Brassica cretica]